MARIVQKELSYKIVGILFKVHSELGSHHREKYYQRAVAKGLQKEGLRYRKEIPVELNFEGESVGKYFIDFVVENKIVLELKAKPFFHSDDIRQVLSYLKAANLELGILANFRTLKLTYKRILNSGYQTYSDLPIFGRIRIIFGFHSGVNHGSF